MKENRNKSEYLYKKATGHILILFLALKKRKELLANLLIPTLTAMKFLHSLLNYTINILTYP